MATREENKERDKDRPLIVHCIGLIVQHSTHCDDEDAIDAAWNIFDFFGKPENLTPMLQPGAHKVLRKHQRI